MDMFKLLCSACLFWTCLLWTCLLTQSSARPIEEVNATLVSESIEDKLDVLSSLQIKIYSEAARGYICAGEANLTVKPVFNNDTCIWGVAKSVNRANTDDGRVFSLVHLTSQDDLKIPQNEETARRIVFKSQQWLLENANYDESAKFVWRSCSNMAYIRFQSVEEPYIGKYFSVEYDHQGLRTNLIEDEGCGPSNGLFLKNYLRNIESLFIPMTLD